MIPRLPLAVLMLATSTVLLAAPAPFLPKKKALSSLEGTVWEGDGVVGPTTYRFRPGGWMNYTYGGRTFNSGMWRQDGQKIYWEMNSRYCWFEGEFRDGQMQGIARNKPGGRWDLKMRYAGSDDGKSPPPKPRRK